jgi:excisionase family DNA binding protein
MTPEHFAPSRSYRRRGSARTIGTSAAASVNLPMLVDIHDIADHLGVTVRHIRQLVAERRIPYVKWGKLLRFDPHEVAAWLTQRRVDPVVHGGRDRRVV